MRDPINFIPIKQDAFHLELVRNVNSYFDSKNLSKKADFAMWFRAGLMITGLVSTYSLLVFGNLPYLYMVGIAVVLGAFIAGTGCTVSHDALHNTYSDTPSVNKLMGRTMDVLGANGYLWKINHNAHHRYTNMIPYDGDIKDNPLMRFSPHSKKNFIHKLQIGTVFLIYGLFLLLIIFNFNFSNILNKKFGPLGTIRHSSKKVVGFIFWKLVYFTIWLVIPILVMPGAVWEYLTLYVIFNMTAGYIFSFNFMCAHNCEATIYPNLKKDEKVSWAEYQMRTTSNYKSKNPLFLYFIGGLDHQVEHHLFPGISSTHYKALAPIIKETAEAHGVPYNVKPSFYSIVKSHFVVLYKRSIEEHQLAS